MINSARFIFLKNKYINKLKILSLDPIVDLLP